MQLERFAEHHERPQSKQNSILISVEVNHYRLQSCLFETQANRVPERRRGSIAQVGGTVCFVNREQRLDVKIRARLNFGEDLIQSVCARVI